MEIADRVRWLSSLSPPPASEAQTRFEVLDPILLEDLGYERSEVSPEAQRTTTGVPDYIILPGAPEQWFLEAKAWGVALTDAHARQATTYAYQSGSRWVVVTNGRCWRLYDSQVLSASPADKLVAEATSAEPEALTALLGAMRADAVRAGGLASFAQWSLLERLLRGPDGAPDREVVSAVWSVAKKRPGLAKVTKERVAEAMRAGVATPCAPAATAPTVAPAPQVATGRPDPPTADGGWVSIADPGLDPTGRKPVALRLPDGSARDTRTWRDVLVGVSEWLLNRRGPEEFALPFSVSERASAKTCLVNKSPTHRNGRRMDEPRSIAVGGQELWIETFFTATISCKAMSRLCREIGIDPEGIQVRLAASDKGEPR
ncbi:MAG TPA: hypothetical protein VLH79_13360 [Chthonomonadales bacterium]|nr:hypothetical protein [Chthonomonadales bacterium]